MSELIGAELDAAVARAEGWNYWEDADGEEGWRPSTDWSQGGPIIERERINLNPWVETDGRYCDDHGYWHDESGWDADGGNGMYGRGPTPLIAAMRAFIASKT